MTREVGALLLAGLLAGCAGEEQPGAAVRRFDPGPAPDSLFAGAAFYREYCSSCHGNHGDGDGLGPPLVDPRYDAARFSDDSFLVAVRQGAKQRLWSFGDMPVIHRASPGDVARITAYVRWLQGRADALSPTP